MKSIKQLLVPWLLIILVSFGISPQALGQTVNAQEEVNSANFWTTNARSTMNNRVPVARANAAPVSTASLVGNAYYIRYSVGEPWANNTNPNAMTAVFGAGNFITTNFLAAVPGTVFSAATGFVYLDGSDNGANELNAFLTANLPQIQSWVAAGGRLYIKAAPNVGGSINLGFGGVVLNYSNATPLYSPNANATLPGHPIFAGPYSPVVTSYTGNWFAHGTISGGSFTNIMNGSAPGCVLGGQAWGSGFVMFGTGTATIWQSPSTEAQNLLQNTLYFVANNATIQCSYTASGTLIVPPGVTSGTYKLWGAGGGSGVTAGTAASGGGGGGGYTQVNRINLVPGSTFPVTIGAGGAPGSDGGFSQIEGAIASGGKSGTTTGNGGFGGGQTAPLNVVPGGANFPSGFSFKGGDGGAASSPFELGGGGGGASATATANGNNGTTSSTSSPNGGAGGATNGGNGGNASANGNNGTAIGGGGGGRGSGAGTIGGTGAGGQLDVVWNCGTLTSISYPSPTVCSYASPLTATIVPATATGGTFSSPTLGTFLNASTGAIAPGAPQGTHVITYGWAAFCTCPAQSVTFTLVIAPQAVATGFTYGGPHCSNVASVSPSFTTLSGVPGVYTSTAGLTLNATTGVITPTTSTPGTYTVTYTVAANGNCNAVTASTSVTITPLPTIAGFDYPGDNTYCAGEGVQTPTSVVTNPNNNAVSYSSTTGLTLNTTTGAIDPATSTPGVYVVTMTIAAGGGCAAVTATSTVEILARPTATIAYTGNPFCQTVASTMQPVVISGVTGGPLTTVDFTATPAGLTINSTTGAINLNSTPGTYTVKYRFTGLNGCLDSSSTSVTIKPRPTSTISYTGANPICSNVSPTVGGNVTAVGPWTLTLSNGQTTTGIGNGPWSIIINTLNPGDGPIVFTVTSLVDANCNGVANPDMPGSVTITKRTITSGTIPSAANTRVCEGQAASINVILTSMANCAPAPRFSGVFAIEYFDGAGWQPHPTNPTFAWTSNAGASTTGTATAISIPAAILNNPNSYTLQYRISWVSLVDCNGCAADPLTGNVIVEIVPNPLLLVTAAPTGDVCPGTVVPFTVSQAANSYVLPQFALFNWIATATTTGGVTTTIGQGQNVSLGTINVNTPPCPFNGTVTVRFTPLNTSCCNCLYTPIVYTFTVRDITAPVLITGQVFPPNVANINSCMGDANLPVNPPTVVPTATQIAALYTDNCGGLVTATRTGGRDANSTNCAWSYTYTYVISDPCGNTVTRVLNYSGGDKTAPTLITAGTFPANQTLINTCMGSATLPAAPTVVPSEATIAALYSDNCGGTITVVRTGGLNAGSTNCAWSYTYSYSIKDVCNNEVTPIPTITISGGDKTAPTLITAGTFPANQTLINTCMGSATLPAAPTVVPSEATIAALYVDNCGGAITVVRTGGRDANSTNCAWSYTYTYVISDVCNNSLTRVLTFSGGDKTAPTLITAGTFPANQTLINTCMGSATLPAAPTVVASEATIAALYSDNCGGAITVVRTGGLNTGSTNCAWSYTYTYTITDACGNAVTPSPTITYSGGDKTAPTLITAGTFPANQTLINTCMGSATLPAAPTVVPSEATIAALYVDNCGGAITVVRTGGRDANSTNCAWSYTYTYVISDVCNNSLTRVLTFSGGDKTAPTLITAGTFPPNQIEINGCIGTTLLPAPPTVVASEATIAALYSDNCGGAITVVRTGGLNAGSTNCAWSYTYTYTITDACGNAVTPSPTITYSGADVSAPVFTNIIPTQVINTGAGANCSGIMPDYRSLANVTDCGTFTLEQLAPNAPGTMVFGFNGTRNVVIRATDACGNVSTTTFVVELKDLTAPVAICKPFTVVLNAAGTGSIVLANINNGSYDNCTPTNQLVFGISQTNFTCANVGTNNVILTITDLCNNVSTCTAVVTVVDNTAPVISCFGDTTINKDANCTYTMPDLTFRVNKADACGFNANSVTQSIPVGSIFGASITSIPVTLTVTDKNGNSSTCTFTINFADVTPPVIVGCPANITVFTGLGNTLCSQTATWTPPTATDACIVCCTTQSITGNFAPGATFPVGVTTVIYTATDVSGNTSTCSFTVTVIDNTRPLIANCPANISLTTGAGSTICGRAATWTEPTATDNCTASANLVRTRSHAPGFVFPVGVTTVTYTFADAAGNVSLPCTFTVTVTDNTVPIITCPGNIVNPPINTAGCLATVVTANPTFSDNCQVTRLTWAITGAGITPAATSPTTGINYLGTRTFNFGVTTVTYTATDAAGNSATCSYTVSVTRPLNSVISGTSTVMQNNTGTSNILFTTKGGTAPYTIVYTAPAGGFPSAGSQTIITTGTNSSTVGGDPNWLVTTVPQSSATPGTYTYTLVSVTDAFGCVVTPNTTATVTVISTNYPAPDLTPSFSLGTPYVQPAASKTGFININNISANVTTGSVYLEVYAPSNFNLTISETMTSIGATTVSNNDFDIVSYPGLGYAISSKPGVVIPAGSNLKLGFIVDAVGSISNSGNLTVILGNGTGGIATVVGDNNSNNNKGSKTYSINN